MVLYNHPALMAGLVTDMNGVGREETDQMAVSYKKLFKILIDRDMKKKEFRELVGISYSTMAKLEKGENTNVDVLERICLKMGCRIEDIMEILPGQGTADGAETDQ